MTRPRQANEIAYGTRAAHAPRMSGRSLLAVALVVSAFTSASHASEALPPLPPPPPVSPRPPPAAIAPATDPRRFVRVTLASAHDARLEVSDGAAWVPICDRPCDIDVPADETYRVTGPDMKPSEGFVLTRSEAVVLDVRAAPLHRGPLAGLVLGPMLSLAGVGLTYLGIRAYDDAAPSSSEDDPRPLVIACGIAAAIAGLGWFSHGVTDAVSPPPKHTTVAMRGRRLRVHEAPSTQRRKPDPARRPDWYGRGRELVPAPATATIVKLRF